MAVLALFGGMRPIDRAGRMTTVPRRSRAGALRFGTGRALWVSGVQLNRTRRWSGSVAVCSRCCFFVLVRGHSELLRSLVPHHDN